MLHLSSWMTTLSLIKLMQELYGSHFEETAFGTLSISK
jgi:aspartyl aminopeptidase